MSLFRCFLRFLSSARRLWLVLVFVISASFLSVGFAQSDDRDTASSAAAQPSVPKYSAEVKVVSLLATVRDKHGQFINNLSKEDFALEEDGRPQTIKYFVRETDMPLKLGLLVDTSMSTLKELPDERNASVSFLDQLVREDKDAGVCDPLRSPSRAATGSNFVEAEAGFCD